MKDVCIYLSCKSRLSHLNDVRYPKSKSGSGALGPKSTSRDSKSITFAKVFFSANKIEGGGSKTEGSPSGKSISEFDVFAPAPAPHA